MPKKLLFLWSALVCILSAQGQEPVQNAQTIQLPTGYLDQVSAQTDRMARQLTFQTEKYLKGMEQSELRLRKKAGKLDSVSATNVLGDVHQRYSQWQQRLNGVTGVENQTAAYIPALDSLKNTLRFLQSHADLLTNTQGFSPEKLQATLDKVQGLQNRLNIAERVKDQLQQRRQYLTGQLEKLGLGLQLTEVNKQAYYYKQQLNDYKEALNDPVRLQKKVVQLLGQVPAYRQFLQRHSYLATLFGTPEDYHVSDSGMKQLQTRAIVQKMIQDKIGAGGPAGEQQVMQQVQQSENALGELRNKLLALGTKEIPADPGFKPNSQKTKSLWKRLEYGANLQFAPATGILPSMADLGLSLGYKLNDKASLGVGAAFKMGLGDGLNHIHFSGEGAGLRSYIDWRLKKNFYLSGGYERNYLNQFQSLTQLRNAIGWQQSGLIGISRKYKLSTKVNGKLQLLYDFLNSTHVPNSAPILFRTGWTF
jgi:hypothetical protein